MILKCIFNKWDGEEQTGFIWLGIGTVGRQTVVNAVINLQGS
jgi:hypothetical protein